MIRPSNPFLDGESINDDNEDDDDDDEKSDDDLSMSDLSPEPEETLEEEGDDDNEDDDEEEKKEEVDTTMTVSSNVARAPPANELLRKYPQEQYMLLDMGEEDPHLQFQSLGHRVLRMSREQERVKKRCIPEQLEEFVRQLEHHWIPDTRSLATFDETRWRQWVNSMWPGNVDPSRAFAEQLERARQSHNRLIELIGAMILRSYEGMSNAKANTQKRSMAFRLERVIRMQNVSFRAKMGYWETCASSADQMAYTRSHGMNPPGFNVSIVAPPGAQELSNLQNYFLLLLTNCRCRGYRKSGDSVYQEKVYNGFATRCFERVSTIEEYILDYSRTDVNHEAAHYLTADSGNNLKRVADFLTKTRESSFPTLVVERNVYGCRNGLLDARVVDKYKFRPKFYPYSNIDVEPLPDVIANHFVDCELTLDWEKEWGPDFQVKNADSPDDAVYLDVEGNPLPGKPELDTFMNIDTPVFKKILTCQNIPRVVQMIIYALFGRMGFPIGQLENWQIALFIQGRAGTGKTTLIKWFSNVLYDPEFIFQIASRGEGAFGMEDSIGKLLWIIAEMKGDCSSSPSMIQQMISGESIVVHRKHQIQQVHIHRSHGVMLSNDDFPWMDSNGEFERRLASVKYEVTPKVDTTLDVKIQKESMNALYKCILAYHYLVLYIGTRGFHEGVKCLTSYFSGTGSSLRAQTNMVETFLNTRCNRLNRMEELDDVDNPEQWIVPLPAFEVALGAHLTREKSTKRMTALLLEASLDKSGFQVFPIGFKSVVTAARNDEDQAMLDIVNNRTYYGVATRRHEIKSITYNGMLYTNCKVVQGVRLINFKKNHDANDEPEFFIPKIVFDEPQEVAEPYPDLAERLQNQLVGV